MTAPQRDLFAAWSDLNQVICDWRSRFDDLREELPKCTTRGQAGQLLAVHGYAERYPLLPDWLP